MRTDTRSRKFPNNMFHESQREAMGRDNFTTNSKRKHFMCTDRRDFTNYQNAVEELEQKKRRSIKRYDEEIVDCKQIYRQFELQKQGMIPYGGLITGNQKSIKSSVTFRQQNLLKSVRRSLAPRTTLESSTRPVLNYELISKPPSVPHRIKIEIAKREQRRMKEAEEIVNYVELTKPESTNIYLDDAVAMYARLRKEVNKEMEKRSHMSFSSQPVIPDARPVSVPSISGLINNPDSMANNVLARFAPVPKAQTRTVSALPSVATASYVHLPPASQKTDSSSKSKGVKTTPITLPKQIDKESARDKKIKSKANEQIVDKTSKIEKIKMGNEKQNGKEPQDENVFTANANSATNFEGNEGELVTDEDNIIPPLMNNFCISPKKQMRSVAFTLPEHHENMHSTNTSQNEINFKQNDELSQTRLTNRSRTFVASGEEENLYNLGERASTLPLLNKQRRSSDSTLSDIIAENGSENKTRVERRSNSITELSTDKLHAIISEKIIGQLTNVQRRSSISSNQQTSLLKNYARMLQTQLKLDEIPESDSPDFSETPFMRSTTKANKHESEQNKKTETEKVTGSQLWKSHLKFGSFRSALTYSEIEEEDKIDPKVRRRLRLTSIDAAGIVTQKEKSPKLAKLRKNSGDSVFEDGDNNVSENTSEHGSTNF